MDTVVTRRHFLFRGHAPLRPPWSVDEGRFLERCRHCDRCRVRCPEGILVADRMGRPRVDFTLGMCTFCGQCREVCPSGAILPVPDQVPASPWSLLARATVSCLPLVGIHCQSCGDVCAPRAIRFPPRLGAPAQPVIDAAACTGCGACVRPCPVGAMTLRPREEQNHAA